jgi:glycosyltransferase involved in cell wall biosynthesis
LSENFGLVVAEALERGKRVITTDGAPAWDDGNDYGGRLICIKGYRTSNRERRVKQLKAALLQILAGTIGDRP